ncbi:MAG TPA: hypothetical protein VHR45_11655 [Thermoanaerobaculia bacterium]|nr:hypothetical protein [Thermoanaerobaculia bacterium]
MASGALALARRFLTPADLLRSEDAEPSRVDAVFHGHAHRGRPEGRTAAGVPVYNVSLTLLRRVFPDRPPFRVIEVEIAPKAPIESWRPEAALR